MADARTPLNQRRIQLEQRMAVLAARMVDIDAELESHDSRDWEDLALERETDEVLEGIGQQAQAEIRLIRAALARIEEGEYGFCTRCGVEISQERLDVLPFTPFCRDCAR